MSRSTDLFALLRGLDKVRHAFVTTHGGELSTAWQNSSLRTAVHEAGMKAEGKVSDAFVKTSASELPSEMSAFAEKLKDQTSSVLEKIMQKSAKFTSATEMDKNQADLSDIPPFMSELDVPFDGKTENTASKMEDISKRTVDHQFESKTDFTSVDKTENFAEHKLNTVSVEANENASVEIPVLDSIKNEASQTQAKNSGSSPLGNNSGKQSRNFHHNSVAQPIMDDLLTDIYGVSLKKKDSDRKSEVKPAIRPVVRQLGGSATVSQGLSKRAKERRVPSSRLGRLMSYGGLAAGLGVGAVAQVARKGLGLETANSSLLDSSSNPFLTQANAERIVNTLCKVRGAALKLGQMISIQDSAIAGPELQAIFERVRQSADFMPARQMEKVLYKEWGPDWRSKVQSFDEKPFAAASIGQVHKATLHDGRIAAVKIQYPGVAKGINSDIDNLVTVMNMGNLFPAGLYVENFIEVAKKELAEECDYLREAESSRRFREMIKDDPFFYVPEIIDELTTGQVLTSEMVRGEPLDKFVDLDQDTRNHISSEILRLCLEELFVHNFMQTDPNWANFLYDKESNQICLLDFGASRSYSKKFVDDYVRVIRSAQLGDRKGVLEWSQKLGFLTGYETKVMEEAHIDAVMILGIAFSTDGPFDFSLQNTTHQIRNLIPIMLKHRLTAPPEETYSLHRKMSGSFLLCTKLKAQINCKVLFDKVWENYEFSELEGSQ